MQKKFGRLTSDPMPNIKKQIEIANWLLQYNIPIEGKTFFEVGTGHNAIVPVGFFLSGANRVITVDLYKRLDYKILKDSLIFISKNRDMIESLNCKILGLDYVKLKENLDLLSDTCIYPKRFLKKANIKYLALSDAESTILLDNSVDYHFSTNTREHISYEILRNLFIKAKRILKDNDIAIYFKFLLTGRIKYHGYTYR